MQLTPFKQDLFEQFARIGSALSNGKRLEILECLAQRERSVDALASLTGLSVANASQHLKQLKQAGLVETRREGKYMCYRVADPEVLALLDLQRRVAEKRLAEVQQMVSSYLGARDSLEPIDADQLMARSASGDVTVLDVRPPEEYAAGHLPGALNITPDQLEAALEKLPRDRQIVAYCRGPYCVLSFDAVKLLRARGFDARRLDAGFPEWRLAGMPVEVDPEGSRLPCQLQPDP